MSYNFSAYIVAVSIGLFEGENMKSFKYFYALFGILFFAVSCSKPDVPTMVWPSPETSVEMGEVSSIPDVCEMNLSFTVEYNLNQVVGISGEQIDMAIAKMRPDSLLIGLGADIVQVGNELGINPFYIAAHAAWESSWGTSKIARDKNNLFGYGANDSCPYECAYSYSTKKESIEEVMKQVKTNYLTEGGQYYNGPNLSGMNQRYATDQNWENGISSIMNSLLNHACASK
jgi:beta-N-acetylglucosaminidase